MVEPVTTIGIGAIAAYLGKDGLQKLLGPTADYIGMGMKDFTQKRIENIGKIFSNASAKLGDKIDVSGAIPPKLLKQVVDDGSFADDDVEIEYLGGIMASSRSDIKRDNRGVAIAKLIDNLSNYQIRAHYLIYRTIKDCFENLNISPNMNGRPRLRIYVPVSDFVSAMDFNETEKSKLEQILSHTLFGLHNQNLIEGHFEFGPVESMQKTVADAPEAGFLCQPSALGLELLMWAFGLGDAPLLTIFSKDFDPKIDGIPLGFTNALPIEKAGRA